MQNQPIEPNDPNDPDQIKQFVSGLFDTAKTLLHCGQIAREQIQRDKDWPQRVHDFQNLISVQFINRIAQIGIKFLPEYFLDESDGGKKIKLLPLEEQKRWLGKSLPMLIQQANGSWEVLQVDLRAINRVQADQIFARDHVRTEAEQRAHIEFEREKKQDPPLVNLPWRIVGDEIIFMAGARLKIKTLLKELKKAA